MKKFVILIIASIMLGSCNVSVSNGNKAIAKIDSLFCDLYPQNEPGAAVLIMKKDEIIFSKGYGVADMVNGTKIDQNTFFNIASVSKQFSAVALIMLAEEGKLSLDDTVRKWFPEFTSPLMEKITLRHLLSHTSGIPDSRDRTDRVFVTTATDTQSYAYIGTLAKLNFEPGSSYEYMNPTFQLMYTIIERSSGMSFDSFMKEKIFNIAGMYETTYFEADKMIPNMAHGYLPDSTGTSFKQYDYGEESFFATKADGGIYTSVNEFVKWELALRNNLLISEAAKNEAHSPKIKIGEISFNSYGYGWFIEEKPGFPVKIYHTGDNGGFQIFAGRYPEKEILYLFFSNRNDRNRENTATILEEIMMEAGWLD
jgi:CubicO group peptidase (beta-lactamase class C family)